MGELHEKCAVVGVVAGDEELQAAAFVSDALHDMQHRGEDATGIVSWGENANPNHAFGLGRVAEVYSAATMRTMLGGLAIGHNRYPTSGDKGTHIQPILDSRLRLAFAHNGNIPDTSAMDAFLGSSLFNPALHNDSEKMLYCIGELMRQGMDLPDATRAAYPLFTGSFSCTAMHKDTVVAFRDPCGIRPLSIGQLPDGGHMFASETCALDGAGATHLQDVRPGEMVVATHDGLEFIQVAEPNPKLDIFEMIYFARQDSRLHGMTSSHVRMQLGRQLALEQPITGNRVVAVGVPDSATPIAHGYAEALGLPHLPAITRDRYYTGRSFMQPSQRAREQMVMQKFHFIPEFIQGNDLVIIDDSIVRLTTQSTLIKLLERYNPNSISVLIGSPPIGYADHYGIDTPEQDELAAAYMTIGEMREKIGVRNLGFLSLAGMISATGQPQEMFNLSSFTGKYPIPIGSRARNIRTPAWMLNQKMAAQILG